MAKFTIFPLARDSQPQDALFLNLRFPKALGDKAFAEFLTDEIKEEKKIQKHKSLPKLSGGWELDVQGTEAKLTRKVAGET
ncbi:Complement component 1 Q subcomponent-binding protein, mitochondrial [Varanus komodoensis]|nr:Complement component 1 Q subcomponent-binding protein, mitochondrial [Varanus komodoensis]